MNQTDQPALRQFNAQVALQQRSVAIVDDDPQISQALGQWVELQGLHALYFSCAECLLQALAHLLRGLDANLPLVIVTALREDERRRYGQLPAGVACLQKPFDLDALENALFPILH